MKKRKNSKKIKQRKKCKTIPIIFCGGDNVTTIFTSFCTPPDRLSTYFTFFYEKILVKEFEIVLNQFSGSSQENIQPQLVGILNEQIFFIDQ